MFLPKNKGGLIKFFLFIITYFVIQKENRFTVKSSCYFDQLNPTSHKKIKLLFTKNKALLLFRSAWVRKMKTLTYIVLRIIASPIDVYATRPLVPEKFFSPNQFFSITKFVLFIPLPSNTIQDKKFYIFHQLNRIYDNCQCERQIFINKYTQG